MKNNCWLPCLEEFNDYGDWGRYEAVLYEIFKNDFIATKPCFENKPVNIRKHPMEGNKEQAFFHVTSQDYFKDCERVPDMRRCERIRWIRSFIEKYKCDPTKCIECQGVKVWEEEKQPKWNGNRVHLLLEEERFMVVLERRGTFFLLVTAFYLERDHTLRKKIQQYINSTSKIK